MLGFLKEFQGKTKVRVLPEETKKTRVWDNPCRSKGSILSCSSHERRLAFLWHLKTLALLDVVVMEERGNVHIYLWDASVGAKEYLWWSDQLWLGAIPS